MEEIKKLAAHFAVEFAKEKGVLKKYPLLALAITGIFAEGFEFAYSFDGSKDDCNIGENAFDYVSEKFEDIEKEDRVLFLLFVSTYAAGEHKGFDERDGITLDKDENGNIIGLTR